MTQQQDIFPPATKVKKEDIITPLTPPHVAAAIRARAAKKVIKAEDMPDEVLDEIKKELAQAKPSQQEAALEELEALAADNALKRPARAKKAP